MSSTDAISQLQHEYTQFMKQAFSAYSWNNQRHPLVAPDEIPGLPFTAPSIAAPNGPGAEDKLPAIAYPLEPRDDKEFAEAQQELAEDLIIKVKQIQQLIIALPGIDKDEEQQAQEIQKLVGELEKIEEQKKAKRKEMHLLVKRLEAVVGGMDRSIGYKTDGT